MNTKAVVCVFAAGVVGVVGAVGSARGQAYTFDTGTDGWMVFNISYQGDHVVGRTGTGQSPAWDTTEGLPAPSLRIEDLTGETWIGAPAGSLGPRLDLLSGAISFDVMYRTHDNATYAQVGIEGLTEALYIPEDAPTLNVWLHRSYALVPGLWHVNTITGPLATAGDIAAVLANVTGVYIHTEWTTGADDTSVDNIVIGAAGPACGSADFNCDGDTGTDSDIEAFFACLAGNCPAPPCASSADFNGDGDTGTDSDIEAFFRVLAGGMC